MSNITYAPPMMMKNVLLKVNISLHCKRERNSLDEKLWLARDVLWSRAMFFLWIGSFRMRTSWGVIMTPDSWQWIGVLSPWRESTPYFTPFSWWYRDWMCGFRSPGIVPASLPDLLVQDPVLPFVRCVWRVSVRGRPSSPPASKCPHGRSCREGKHRRSLPDGRVPPLRR